MRKERRYSNFTLNRLWAQRMPLKNKRKTYIKPWIITVVLRVLYSCISSFTMETTKVLLKPLNGSNYATWKVQCRMALIKEGLWNIVNRTELISNDATREQKEKFSLRRDKALATIVLSVEPKWLYILGSDPTDPTEVWHKLADQFQRKSWANKLSLRRKLYSLKLNEDQSVQSHIKAITEIFDKLSIIGDPLDDENKVVHLLASLPKSFDMLVTALEASPEVPKMEVVTERLLYEESKHKNNDKSESNNKLNAMAGNHRPQKKGLKCYHCGKPGHIKRDCYQLNKRENNTRNREANNLPTKQKAYTAGGDFDEEDKETIGLLAGQSSNTSDTIIDWIIDSGASCHMCNNESLFTVLESLDVPQEITLGDGFCVKAVAKGTIYMHTRQKKKIQMRDVLFVSKLTFNLLSVAKTAKAGKFFEFSDSSCQIIDEQGRVIAVAEKIGNLYHLKCCGTKDADSETAMKCSSNEDTTESLWHRRFGHLGVQNMEKLKKDQLVNGFNYNVKTEQKFCEPCIDGKHHKLPFPKKGGERSTELLGKVHSDVCGKSEVKSLSGAEYFVTFIDDKSKYVWTYVLKNKSDVFKKFHEWKAMVEKSSGMKLKTFRTDNDGEYTSNEFEEYLRQDGTQHETTVPKTPQQNGVAERMNRTLIDSVRAMLSDSKLPKRFWAEALSTATYLHNRSPTNAVKGMTPHEAWTGVKPNVSHLRVFGCDAYPHIPKDERSKMDPKAKKSIFLGYGDGVKGYRLYNKEKQRIFYSRDVVFNETKPTQANNPAEGNEVPEQPLIEIETTENDATVEAEAEDVNQQPPQRERQAPDRLGDWVYVAKDLHDPMTVEEALSRKNKDDWRLAMEDEVNSMFNNDVWDLVELPKGRKAVGSKWVFKTKHDADGNLQRYKARLVAQGYNQKQGINYDETFSPVVRFESIRTIISLAAQHNLHLQQIDIKTAFLNGWLKEDIYMKQPQEFEVKGKEHLVCKLKRSIYGLKQSPRCWNDKLDTFMKELGLRQSNNDPCIYILESKNVFLVVGVFVDDLVIAGSSTESIKDFVEKLSRKFKVKDMGKLHYFLGVQVNQKPGKILIG